MKNKQPFLSILLIVLILISLCLLLLKLSLQKQNLPKYIPPQNNITTLPTIQPNAELNNNLSTITFPNPPTIPFSELSVYKISFIPIHQTVLELVDSLELPLLSSNYWYNQDTKTSLSFEEESGTLQLSFPNKSTAQGIDSQSAKSQLELLLNQFNIAKSMIDIENAFFGDNSPEPITTHSRLASNIRIPFYYLINNFPLLFNNQSVFEQYAILNADYQLLKLRFNPPIESVDDLGLHPLLSIYEALEEVKNNNAIITHSNDVNSTYTAVVEEFDSIIINSMQIEYRMDLKTGTAAPFYHFFGVASGAQNQYNVHILTSAIKNP
jgi:hypothetical protein